ncbi:MAG: WD40/YVTN/BNR-like repeat-containing protein, partial [Calditrichia bacterium]
MRILILLILSGSIIYPSVNTVRAQLEPFGLEGKTISDVSLFPSDFIPQLNYVCAGTDSDGVFLRSLASPDSPWVNYGLSGKNITAVYVYLWGAGPGDFFTLLAGSRPSFASGDSTLLYHRTFLYDTTWSIADNGLNAEQLDHIRCISGIFYGGHEPPQPLFLGAGTDIFGSNGFPPQLFWQTSWSGAAVLTLEILQRSLSFPFGIVWAGGVANAQTPLFVKSMDAGNTWILLPSPPGGDNECHSIAIDPLHPDTVYAGMRDVVIKTTNGGQNWIDVSPPISGVIFFGVEINPTNPEHLIAGGTSFSGSEFVLFETHDGGNSWTEILPGQTIAGITAMDSHVEGAEFVVYMGTGGDGIYRYKSPVAGIKE